MRDPESLYQSTAAAVDVPPGLPLVAAFTGFADAGNAASRFGDHLISVLDPTPVAVFDNDELLDYRARRPIIRFDEDHLVDYEPARLALYLAEDDLGQPFLLLNGYEPDFQWERFIEATIGLIARHEVSATTWVHSIPMPVPHTRPMGVTVSGNRRDLIDSLSVWKPTTRVPATALHLLEHRLHAAELPVSGFVLLVPHYLADTEHPGAAVAALESVSAATGLIFPTDSLREESRDFVSKIDQQVDGNEELARLVATLETRYDSYMEDITLPSPLADVDGELPTADEIAAELQRFLAARRDDDA